MRRIAVALFVLVLIAVGCSGDDGDEAAPSSSTTSAATASSTSASTSSETTTSVAETTTAAPTTTEAPPAQELHVPGPYDVGVKTLDLGDRQAEVWYPAEGVSGETEVFDTLSVFPPDLAPLIPEELSGLIDTGAYRDAAPSSEVAPASLPLVVYSHGFGGFRQVATAHTVHLASWGHVVASTDHLERGIVAQATNNLGGAENQDLADVTNTIDAVIADSTIGPLVDADSFMITGHSAGAGTSARYAAEDVVDGYVSIAGGAPDNVAQKPALVVIGEFDAVVEPSRSRELFDQLGEGSTLIDIEDAGHNSFTDSCRGIRDEGGLEVLIPLIGEEQVERADNGCVPPMVQPEASIAALNHYTLAFLDVLFENDLVEDGAGQFTTDLSGTIAVPNVDVDSSGEVPVVLADFATK